MSQFEGIITALVTPFKNNEIDFGSLKKLIRSQLEQGIDGLVIHGTTGESPTVTGIERKRIFEFVKSEVSNQIPLIVGTGTNSTMDSIEKSKEAEDWGADAVLVVVPYYNKPPQRGLYKHFKMIADKINIPVILYNVPGRTITSLEVETIWDLSKVDNIVGIKEATGDLAFGERIINQCGKDFIVLSGDDGSCMDLADKGGRGVISVVSHLIAGPMKEIYKEIKMNKKDAKVKYNKYQSIIKEIYKESNPIPVKFALKAMGILETDEMRLPLVSYSEQLKPSMISLLKEMSLIK